MKKLLNTPLVLLVLTGMLVASCDFNDDPSEPNYTIVEEDAEASIVFEDLDNLTLKVLSNSGLSARTAVDIPTGSICESAVITIDEESKKITVDFGEGCTNSNGVTRKGIINLTYTAHLLFPGAKIITTFDGYEVDGKKVEGTRTITNKEVDIETNAITLEVTIQNGKVTWADGSSVTVSSEQLRKINLGTQGNYEVSITGSASGTSRSGLDYTSSVTEALIYTRSCLETGVSTPLSGIVSFQFNEIEASVDYGDGTCDKMATVFYPTGSKQVTLD
ncbi:hypothetical protein [Algoriphagus sp. NG3]|uniref:hypothetical protein n=1 Tax=Algoriphagus sp. NG3 TaxID=3097546 RepID=UPI002A8411E0|nr:hypothetical protein [Algoriphagus sp. NG3]WPR75168.1 hypothetical protein SLW71_21125 [Algoriphagus sp. NG3]